MAITSSSLRVGRCAVKTLTVQQAEKDFTNLVDQVYAEGISIDLKRDDKVIARLTPPSRLLADVGELNAFLRSLRLGDDPSNSQTCARHSGRLPGGDESMGLMVDTNVFISSRRPASPSICRLENRRTSALHPKSKTRGRQQPQLDRAAPVSRGGQAAVRADRHDADAASRSGSAGAPGRRGRDRPA